MTNWYICIEPGTLDIVDRFEGTEEDVKTRSSRLEFVKLEMGLDPKFIDVSRDESGTIVVQKNEEKVKKSNEDVHKYNVIQFKSKRDILLQKSDWVVSISDSPLPQDKIDEWKVYRQALRDLPSITEDPEKPVWPTPPQ
tara:strand:- start:80 stop:496 length:417 start_codon:yes stop_codon:yes gene_type:complete